ncbi:MAG: glycosyltransferase family 4 protein, partial [Planctomycetales bacterium]
HERTWDADVCSLHGTPHDYWVRRVRGKKFPSLHDRALIAAERRMMCSERRQVLLPVSSLVESLYEDAFDLRGKTSRVLPPGVDPVPFSADRRERARREIRARHGIRPDEFVVLFVGMNWKHKGLFELINAVSRAKRSDPAARLLVVGKGSSREASRFAQQHGVADAMRFAGMVREGVATDGVAEYCLASDCLALPSRFETFGMVILEAMAAGLPVIATQQVGARDLIRPGVNGFLLDSHGDLNGLTNALLALSDPNRRSVMQEDARRVAARFTWDRHVEELKSVYRETLSAGRRAA